MQTAAVVSMSEGYIGVVGADQRATGLVASINENGTVTLRLAREGESPFDASNELNADEMEAIAHGTS